MSSSSSNPLSRFRPKIKPKSPLRRQSASAGKTPNSPGITSMFKSSSSDSSSLSSHGTMSASNSSTGMDNKKVQQQSTTLKVGEIEISIPLLIMSGVCVFVGGLVLRAFYTFGTSILRLIVLSVAIGTFLVFSQWNDRHQEQQQRKKIFEETRITTPGGVNGSLPNSPIPSPYEEPQRYSPLTTATTTPQNGYFNGYGHAKYATISSPSRSQQQTYSNVDGRTRNLLSPHQRFATHSN